MIGRIGSFRGRAGEMTVRVVSGVGARWTALQHVGVATSPEAPAGGDLVRYDVEHARAYGERLVLKLHGIDDPSAAAALRGRWLLAPPGELPALAAGEHFFEDLAGLTVVDTATGPVGRIVDLLSTGGADVLVVEGEGGDEVLIPFAGDVAVDREARQVRMTLPDGLLELNRSGGAPE